MVFLAPLVLLALPPVLGLVYALYRRRRPPERKAAGLWLWQRARRRGRARRRLDLRLLLLLLAAALTVLALAELGIEQIWARATSEKHAKILSSVGAQHVIFPEAETGERVAHLIVSR
ncbi:MAG: hypothetical protein C4327_03025, partial [Meiothermus sp.]